MEIKTEVIESRTFVGMTPAQLLMLPIWKADSPVPKEQYQSEGDRIYFWLINVFCRKTLEAVADNLSRYLGKGA